MNPIIEIENEIEELLKYALLHTGFVSKDTLPKITLEPPKKLAHGDFTTNLAFQLSPIFNLSPLETAKHILSHIPTGSDKIESFTIAEPGFINITIKNSYLSSILSYVLEEKEKFGTSQFGENKRILIEYVSANPTGPLSLTHARGAAFGDSLSNIMTAAGYTVSREFYINDAGEQVNILASSLRTRYLQELGKNVHLLEKEYDDQYITDMAKKLVEQYQDTISSLTINDQHSFFLDHALEVEISKLKKDLNTFRVQFDNWVLESSFFETQKIKESFKKLDANGYTYEKDGALWFRSSALGDDKDRVLFESDKSYTYLAADIAYHEDKMMREFDHLINIWNNDHHSYIPRIKASLKALEHNPANLSVLIIQTVQLVQSIENVKMSKRSAKYVTLNELVNLVGLDATRYFFAMRSAETEMEFDLNLAISQTDENPVYFAQSAHARAQSVLSRANSMNFTPSLERTHLLTNKKEIELMRKIVSFPNVISSAASNQTPHTITTFIQELSTIFHSFSNESKVVDQDNILLSEVRLSLTKATQITLANALHLIGVSAPNDLPNI